MTSLYEGTFFPPPSSELVELREMLAYCKRLGMPWLDARRETLEIFPNLRPPLTDDWAEEHWLEDLAARRGAAAPGELAAEAERAKTRDDLMAVARKLYEWRGEMTRERR